MARGQPRYHKSSHTNTNNNRSNSRREPEDVNDDYTHHHEEDSRSDVYGSGYNYNPRTSALSAQSSYTSMAFYLPSNTHMVDPYGDEFNEGWNSGGEGSRLSKDAYTEGFNGYPDSRNATQASNSSLAKHFTYSQLQNPPPSSSSRYDPHFRAEVPLPEPIPSSPSLEYKSISSQSSTHLDDPSEARKLLILDLNGTLVHRAPPPKRDLYSGRGQRRNGKRDRDRRGRDRTTHHDVDLKDEFGRDILPPQSVPPVLEKDEFGRDIPRRTPASFTMDVVAEKVEFGRDTRPILSSGVDSEYPSDRDNDNTNNNGNWDFYKDPVYLVQRPLRTVHLRPYIPAFVAYLFHPKTITWLDVMVWSSAQPHSVEDMVRRVFKEHLGNYKPIAEKKGQDVDGGRNGAGGNDLQSGQTQATENEEQQGLEKEKADIPGLIAVWARDTLGLDQAAYNSKTQTTKDLTKPWEKLTPLIPGNEFLQDTEVSVSLSPENTGLPTTTTPISTASPSSLPADALEATPGPSTPTPNSISTTNASKKTPYVHSPQTTLLLDDSPLKARLQPYNHVCVPEYSREIYLRDCKVVPTPSQAKDKETSDDPAPASAPAPAAASDSTTSPTTDIQPSNDEVVTASVEGDATIPAVAVSVTLPDDQTQIDEDPDTEQQLDANTSIDSIVIPTVPNSPSRKRKRTLNDTGSSSDVFFKAESGIDVEVVPGQGVVGPSEGLGLGPGLAGDIGLILQKTKSSLSDMSISADSSASLRTIATEIVGNPSADSIGSAQNYDGMPPPALPVHNPHSLSSMGSGSVGNLNVAQSQDTDERNANKRIPRKYDETMLAVIGILDAIRSESNVAAWMKGKGIFTVVEGDEDSEEEEDESVVKQQAPGETETGIEGGQGLGDSEEDDEELEKLYECNVVKSLKDTATAQPAPPSIFAQPAGFKPKKERWRKKRKVDLGSDGEGGDKVISDAVTATTVPSNVAAMTLPSAHQAPAPAAPTPATSVLVDAAMSEADGSRSNIDETVKDAVSVDTAVNQSETFNNPSSPPPSAPSELQPQTELRNSEMTGGLSSSSSPPATGRDVAIDKVAVGDDDDEIPGLGQFVFQPNLPPSEGTEVIDVDAMDIDVISKLAELDPNRWFQYRHVRKYWIRRGRKALEELGIDVEAHRA